VGSGTGHYIGARHATIYAARLRRGADLNIRAPSGILISVAGPPQVGLRNASGLGYGLECAVSFYLALLCLLGALAGVLIAELLWRVPRLSGNYMFEALGLLCSPLVSLMLADQLSLGAYQQAWYDLKNLGRAQLLLEPQSVALIRRELAYHPLLFWLRPELPRDLPAQLRVAGLWFDAFVQPEDAPWLARYGAQLRSVLAAVLALFVPAGCWALVTTTLLPQRKVELAGLAIGAVALGLTAVQQLRTTAQRQAVLDYFAAHRSV
jgi:hypothetical protein